MEDLFPLLMVIIFIIAPILEGLRNKNKPKQPPRAQHRRVPPRVQQRLPQAPSRIEESRTKPRAEESAATMVPDDLWEVITGQKRTPAPIQYEPDFDEEAFEVAPEVLPTEDVNVEVRRGRVEAQSLETISRHEVPIVISLEENLPTAAERHAAFHQKISAPVPIVERPKAHHLLGLTNRSEIQRAFLLQEVLGKPKGLEGMD